eukprot:COSAG02_NODE_4589_length_5184_cov_87.214749_4_plen_653_part_00
MIVATFHQMQKVPRDPERFEGPRRLKAHERQLVLRCGRIGERYGWTTDSDPYQCEWLWGESNLDNCTAMVSRDGQVVSAAAFSVSELTMCHTGTGDASTLRIGLTDTRVAPSHDRQTWKCLRMAVREQRAQGVLLSLLRPRAAELGAEELAAHGFFTIESSVEEYTLFKSDADGFYHQADATAIQIGISLLEPTDDVLQALHLLHANERRSSNHVVRDMAQTRRVHALPSTFTKIARRVKAPTLRGATAEIIAYIICQHVAELPDGTVRPLTVLEGSGEPAALGMLLRDVLLEHRQQPDMPRFEALGQSGGAAEPVAAIVRISSQSTSLSRVLREHVGPDRQRVGPDAGFARISEPVELLRVLGAAGVLGSAARSRELVEFSLKLIDEDDIAIAAGKREVPGTLVCLRYVDSTALHVAQVRGQNYDAITHYYDSPSEEYFEAPSLSVSALGREVEAMGTRISHWSASRPTRPPTAAVKATGDTRQRKPIGRVIQRQDGGVQVVRPHALGEPVTCTQISWLWSCCGDESSAGDQPPRPVASDSRRTPLPEGVPPTTSLMGERSSSELGALSLFERSVAATNGSTALVKSGTVAAGRWVVEPTTARMGYHATISRAELCGALFGGAHGGGPAVPEWLRETIGCEALNLSDLDWC